MRGGCVLWPCVGCAVTVFVVTVRCAATVCCDRVLTILWPFQFLCVDQTDINLIEDDPEE